MDKDENCNIGQEHTFKDFIANSGWCYMEENTEDTDLDQGFRYYSMLDSIFPGGVQSFMWNLKCEIILYYTQCGPYRDITQGWYF